MFNEYFVFVPSALEQHPELDIYAQLESERKRLVQEAQNTQEAEALLKACA